MRVQYLRTGGGRRRLTCFNFSPAIGSCHCPPVTRGGSNMSTLAHGVTLVHCTKAAARDSGEAASHRVARHNTVQGTLYTVQDSKRPGGSRGQFHFLSFCCCYSRNIISNHGKYYLKCLSLNIIIMLLQRYIKKLAPSNIVALHFHI